ENRIEESSRQWKKPTARTPCPGYSTGATMRKLGRFVLILILVGTGLYLLRVQPLHSKSGKKRLLYLTLSSGFKHESIALLRYIVKQIGDKSGAFETTLTGVESH